VRGKWWRLDSQYRSDFDLRIIAGEVAGTIFVSSGGECNVAICRNVEGIGVSAMSMTVLVNFSLLVVLLGIPTFSSSPSTSKYSPGYSTLSKVNVPFSRILI